ncbi:transmembrane protein 74 [Kryptolebias marmoratus]|uniref:transmembrane protein 74 n=1 Tax=Kryptolebias marmoratus TaxID=37003 RepID=UPI0007F916C8|nr:transmembrane protein 74 [Kryptolebias marmoratus]
MADVELVHCDVRDIGAAPRGRDASGPWTETWTRDRAETRTETRTDPWAEGSGPRTETRSETETCFSCRQDAEEDQMGAGPPTCPLSSSGELFEDEEDEEDIPEVSLLSEDELSSDGSEKSVDYGFILAVSCLVTGISLVAITYTVPRDVRVDPDSVSAREMERLERERARVGAHLDRCVIAGLCLLTLGGVLLSTLLMSSMWTGEMMRRKALSYSQHSAKFYGSMSLRTSPTLESGSHLSTEEDLEVFS